MPMHGNCTNIRFGRLSKTDLIRHNHPETVLREDAKILLPICTKKILSVQQQNRLARWIPLRRDIHIGHSQILPFYTQVRETQLRTGSHNLPW